VKNRKYHHHYQYHQEAHRGSSQDPNMPRVQIKTNVKDENGQLWDDLEPHFCPKCHPKVSFELLQRWINDEACYYCLRQTLCRDCAKMFLDMIDMIYENNQRLISAFD
jgi:hypothetical protein